MQHTCGNKIYCLSSRTRLPSDSPYTIFTSPIFVPSPLDGAGRGLSSCRLRLAPTEISNRRRQTPELREKSCQSAWRNRHRLQSLFALRSHSVHVHLFCMVSFSLKN